MPGLLDDAARTPPFLAPGERPPVPLGLDLVQRAQLCDLLGFVHEEIRTALTDSAETDARFVALPDALPDGLPGRGAPLIASRSWQTGPLDPEETPSEGGSAGGSSAGASGMPALEVGGDSSQAPTHGGPPRTVSWEVWQRLMRLEMDLAKSLRGRRAGMKPAGAPGGGNPASPSAGCGSPNRPGQAGAGRGTAGMIRSAAPRVGIPTPRRRFRTDRRQREPPGPSSRRARPLRPTAARPCPQSTRPDAADAVTAADAVSRRRPVRRVTMESVLTSPGLPSLPAVAVRLLEESRRRTWTSVRSRS